MWLPDHVLGKSPDVPRVKICKTTCRSTDIFRLWALLPSIPSDYLVSFLKAHIYSAVANPPLRDDNLATMVFEYEPTILSSEGTSDYQVYLAFEIT